MHQELRQQRRGFEVRDSSPGYEHGSHNNISIFHAFAHTGAVEAFARGCPMWQQQQQRRANNNLPNIHDSRDSGSRGGLQDKLCRDFDRSHEGRMVGGTTAVGRGVEGNVGGCVYGSKVNPMIARCAAAIIFRDLSRATLSGMPQQQHAAQQYKAKPASRPRPLVAPPSCANAQDRWCRRKIPIGQGALLGLGCRR